MYSMSPEDRACLVMRQQEGWRREVGLERMAAAASRPRALAEEAARARQGARAQQAARAAAAERGHHLRQTARQLLQVLTTGKGPTSRGMAR